jgi:hypothetical protein
MIAIARWSDAGIMRRIWKSFFLQCQGVDLDEIVQKLNQQGTPAEISKYAGNSLCNQALYLTLYYAKVHRMPLRVSFMHLLVLPQQVASGDEALCQACGGEHRGLCEHRSVSAESSAKEPREVLYLLKEVNHND